MSVGPGNPSTDAFKFSLSNETQSNESGGDYYTAMVAACFVAAVAVVAFLVVAGLYLKRTTTYKAIISGNGAPAGNGTSSNGRPFKVYFYWLSVADNRGTFEAY